MQDGDSGMRTCLAESRRDYKAIAVPSGRDAFCSPRAPEGEVTRRVVLNDRYLLGSRLRLREVVEQTGTVPVGHKLTQKIPAVELHKVRVSMPPFGIDLFGGPWLLGTRTPPRPEPAR